MFNGYGKSVGLHQMNETGTLETPVILSNTLNVGIVADALVEWCIAKNDDIGITTSTVNPVVGRLTMVTSMISRVGMCAKNMCLRP